MPVRTLHLAVTVDAPDNFTVHDLVDALRWRLDLPGAEAAVDVTDVTAVRPTDAKLVQP